MQISTENPFFENHCRHAKNEYLASAQFDCSDVNNDVINCKIDVYVFKTIRGYCVCVRFGNNESDYFDLGGLFSFYNHNIALTNDFMGNIHKIVLKLVETFFVVEKIKDISLIIG